MGVADGGLTDKSRDCKSVGGWPYADNIISNEGVTFNVRYIGCLEIKTSMKSLDFQLRSIIAKECINRVCKEAGFKPSKKHSCDKIIQQAVANAVNMNKSGTSAALSLSTKCLTLVNLGNSETMAKYDMSRISFASGGDLDTVDFVAFVAKDMKDCRLCYVLECGGDKAFDLIATIKQAFDLRCKEFIDKQNQNKDLNSEKDYYNDLPGKMPPRSSNLDTAEQISTEKSQPKEKNLTIIKPRGRFGSNLIDLSSPPPDYVNDKCFDVDSYTTHDDVFDMQTSVEVQRSQLLTEQWFHASMSRQAAEALLKHDGDFLVRESQGKPGLYVLTGLQGSTSKHLLLTTDATEGTVRTKDRIFDNISHLINYHWTNALPIIFEQSALVLRNPVASH